MNYYEDYERSPHERLRSALRAALVQEVRELLAHAVLPGGQPLWRYLVYTGMRPEGCAKFLELHLREQAEDARYAPFDAIRRRDVAALHRLQEGGADMLFRDELLGWTPFLMALFLDWQTGCGRDGRMLLRFLEGCFGDEAQALAMERMREVLQQIHPDLELRDASAVELLKQCLAPCQIAAMFARIASEKHHTPATEAVLALFPCEAYREEYREFRHLTCGYLVGGRRRYQEPEPPTPEGDGVLARAVAAGDAASVIHLLSDEELPPLHPSFLLHAAAHNQLAIAEALLMAGASPDGADASYRRPLWFAARNGYEAMVRLLLDSGASRCDIPDLGGHTLYVAAQRSRNEKIIEWLC